MLPRRFALIRHIDYTGVSGIGVVAYGVTFGDGQVVLRWCSTHPATSMWNSMDDLLAVHGHGEATSVEWIDAPHGDLEELPSHRTGPRGRRRADRTEAHRAGREDDTGAGTPLRDVAPPTARDEPPSPGAEPADTATRKEADALPAPEPLPRRRPAGPDARITSADPGAPADDASSRRERPGITSVRTEPESRATRLLTSDECDARNGHLHIDTAPLLLTFRDREETPAERRPQRQGGRHRRTDPDAAG